MIESEENKIPVDALKLLFLETSRKLIRKQDIQNREITPIFWRGIREKLIKGEQLKIVVRGQTTKGKSTLALYIQKIGNEMIKELHSEGKINETSLKKEGNENLALEKIASNQIDLLRVLRREDLKQEFIMTDEFSDMANTGLGATIEQNQLRWYDKVAAQKYLHLIYCTPNQNYDNFGILLLNIIDVDKDRKITKVELFYNDPNSIPLFLGVVTFEVADIFEEQYYKDYYKKKHFAIDLTLKKNIADIRTCEFALATLITFHKCVRLAELGKNEVQIITNRLRKTVRDIGGVYSLLGEAEVVQRIRGLLIPIVEIGRIKEEFNKPRKVSLNERQVRELVEQREIYQDELKTMYKDELDLVKIYVEYMGIGNEHNRKMIENICKEQGVNLEGEYNYGVK